uniref:Heme-binding protein 1 n=1 Tax=Gadus morhua TaxID=8049 RepID=A0A8C4Z9Q9_GADMO
RRNIAAVIGFLLVLTTEASVGDSSLSEFCSETKECLLYTPVCQTEEYEVRNLSSTKWVTTEETSRIMEMATYTAFRRLFKYITGANENGANIEMTSPVIIKSKTNKGWFESCTYTMSFLLPSEHQLNPPKPTDSQVSITEMPGMNVYVKSYGGWMMSYRARDKESELMDSLESVGAMYKKDFSYAVGYDSPMKMFNRHNEVWFVAEGTPVCPATAA